MEIKKYAHATVGIRTNGKHILVDPGKYNYGEGKLKDFNDFDKVDLLLITHSHEDHYMPEVVEGLYERDHPKILTNREIAKELLEKKIEAEGLNPSEYRIVDGIRVTAVRADHKVYTIGFIIDDSSSKTYHCGDTLYFEGEKPYGDLVLVPINNRGVAMGPEEAAKFISEIKPKLAIPIHYESPKDEVKPEQFIEAMKNSGIETKILGFGDKIDIWKC